MEPIKISNEDKKRMIEAVQEGIGTSITEFKMENSLITYNCIHMLKWDYINTNITNNMDKNKYVIEKMDRGIFCPILIYDEENKNLYLTMRPKNLLNLKKDRNKRKTPHYLDALVTKNVNIKVEKEQQELFDTDVEFDNEKIEKILLPISNLEINNFIVCTFEEVNGELISFKAIILDKKLREYYSEDWSKYISPTYIPHIEINPIESETEEDLEIFVKDTSVLSINKKVRTEENQSC